MDTYPLVVGEQQIEVPWWWFDALMVWAGVVGLVLWLFGRKLVKPMFAILAAALVAGLVGGGVRYFSTEMPLVYWMIGGAVLGAAIGWLLARLALAIMFATALAIVAPWLVLILQGTPLPELREPISAAVTELREATDEALVVDEDEETGESETRVDPEQVPSLAEAYENAKADLAEAWGEWWSERSGSTRWAVLSAAGGAVVLGGTMAFVLPNLAGAIMTALLGVLLMLWPIGRGLALLPETTTGWIPQGGWLALLATLFVLLGVLIQTAIFRRKAEED